MPRLNLFATLCLCGDPEMTHAGYGLNNTYRSCFVMSCPCTNYKRDNLKYLEELVDEQSKRRD